MHMHLHTHTSNHLEGLKQFLQCSICWEKCIANTLLNFYNQHGELHLHHQPFGRGCRPWPNQEEFPALRCEMKTQASPRSPSNLRQPWNQGSHDAVYLSILDASCILLFPSLTILGRFGTKDSIWVLFSSLLKMPTFLQCFPWCFESVLQERTTPICGTGYYRMHSNVSKVSSIIYQ